MTFDQSPEADLEPLGTDMSFTLLVLAARFLFRFGSGFRMNLNMNVEARR